MMTSIWWPPPPPTAEAVRRWWRRRNRLGGLGGGTDDDDDGGGEEPLIAGSEVVWFGPRLGGRAAGCCARARACVWHSTPSQANLYIHVRGREPSMFFFLSVGGNVFFFF